MGDSDNSDDKSDSGTWDFARRTTVSFLYLRFRAGTIHSPDHLSPLPAKDNVALHLPVVFLSVAEMMKFASKTILTMEQTQVNSDVVVIKRAMTGDSDRLAVQDQRLVLVSLRREDLTPRSVVAEHSPSALQVFNANKYRHEARVGISGHVDGRCCQSLSGSSFEDSINHD
ncbi:hypothetical protein M8C21_026516, partial [Ambrosia artemisiifolia]